jgi:Uma2 family endonuclease
VAGFSPTVLQSGESIPRARTRRFTYDEVLAMQAAGVLGRDEHFELINGVLVEMSPEGVPHAVMKNRLARHFTFAAGPDVEVYVESPLRLNPHLAPEPDLMLFPAATSYARLKPSDVLLVVEVSDT